MTLTCLQNLCLDDLQNTADQSAQWNRASEFDEDLEMLTER